MKAMIYKDYVTAKSAYWIILVSLAILLPYMHSEGYLFIAFLIFMYLPVILINASFLMESKSGFESFIFTTPLSRKTYVRSKYWPAIFFATLSFALGIWVHDLRFLDEALFTSACFFILPIFFTAIQIPMLLKYGSSKGGLLPMLAFLFVLSFSTYILTEQAKLEGFLKSSKLFMSFWQWTGAHMGLVAALIMGIAIGFLLLSQAISIRIMEAKEF